jgi:hypothetical protein
MGNDSFCIYEQYPGTKPSLSLVLGQLYINEYMFIMLKGLDHSRIKIREAF